MALRTISRREAGQTTWRGTYLLLGVLAIGACGSAPPNHNPGPPATGAGGAATTGAGSGSGGASGASAATSAGQAGQAGASSGSDAATDSAGPPPATGGAGNGAAGSGATGVGGTTGAAGAGGGAGATGAAGVTGATGAAGGTGAAGLTGAAWDAKYPRDKRRMVLHDEGTDTVHYLDLTDPTSHWSAPTTTWSRGLQLVGNGQVMGSRNDGYEEYDLKTGKVGKQVKTFPNTVSAYRMAGGDVMLASGGTLSFLDGKTDMLKKKIQYSGYGYVRIVRPTPQGTFLIPSDTQLFEGDDQGKILWHTTAPGWFHMFEAVRLPSGKILVATGYGSSLDVLDPTTHAVIQQIGTKMMPEAATVKPNFFGDIQVLPNGNYLTANWEGHGGGNGGTGIQVLEFDPAGKLVWFYKQDPMLFSSIQGVMILDGLDPQYLHVLSASGIWVPVMP